MVGIRQGQELLTCYECHENEAAALLFYEKYHKESGAKSFIDPELICYSCAKKFQNSMTLFENRPTIYPFGFIAKMQKEKIGWLLSRKGKEANHLQGEFWKRIIWRIRKRNERHVA